MKERGVTRVLSVLSGAELEYYQIALGDSYGKYFSGHELVSDLKAEGARDKALALLKAAKEAGEKVVVHCAGGQGRTGTVLGTWMVTEYGLSPEEAAKEVRPSQHSGEGLQVTPATGFEVARAPLITRGALSHPWRYPTPSMASAGG
mmetsp:Transcript_64558/g.203771  ORF Transcript_64558/g.203771 Transcript_64558/m.203771 type:complete len:147 (+) Transcript_64558:242-682(+)